MEQQFLVYQRQQQQHRRHGTRHERSAPGRTHAHTHTGRWREGRTWRECHAATARTHLATTVITGTGNCCSYSLAGR